MDELREEADGKTEAEEAADELLLEAEKEEASILLLPTRRNAHYTHSTGYRNMLHL